MNVDLKPKFRKYKAFIFDLDGVVYTGDTPIKTAIFGIKKLQDMDKKVFFLTNNSSVFIKKTSDKLNSMGIDIKEKYILNSALATAIYLKKHNYPKEIYLVGEKAFKEILEEHGFKILNSYKGAKIVVVGINFTFDYEKLKQAIFAINNGAKFIASNNDALMPSEEGFIPGAGTMVAAIREGVGIKPKIIGKPNKSIFKISLDILKAKREETIVIGDRLETDILGGINSNIDTLLVLTGVTKKLNIDKSEIKSNFVINNLKELFLNE